MLDPRIHFNRTRIAPTPSGFLHMGNVLSFAITAALAERTGAKILLRIDDIDRARVNKSYLQDVFDTLNFLDIPWDEGARSPKEFEDNYSQLHRLGMYSEALNRLADDRKLFACTCSRRQLSNAELCTCFNRNIPLTTENASWRMVTGHSPELAVKNFGGKIIHAVLPNEMRDFIVKKRDGFPAYQLTSVIDDLFYGVDFIVRGEDLWPSTLAQHQLTSVLGMDNFSNVTFYHHPLLMEAPGRKLSKSAGATSIKYLRESGKSPADIYQLIASMTGINESVVNWRQLGEIAVNHVPGQQKAL